MNGLLAASLLFAQAANVDQVLAALGQVVESRAKRVASDTIEAQIETQLCSGTLPIANQGSSAEVTLNLGGDKDCVKDARACDADDVFAKSCRLLEKDGLDLTDPYFLKSLSKDTVRFGFRIAAHRMSAKDFEAAALPELADYAHGMMEEMADDGARATDVVEPTLTLARALSSDVPGEVLGAVAQWNETKALAAAVRAKLVSEQATLLVTPDEIMPPGVFDAGHAAACETVRQATVKTRRAFKDLYGAGKPYAAAESKPCSSVFTSAADIAKCNNAQLTLRLAPALEKTACAELSDDPGRDFRNLAYVLSERELYAEALKNDAVLDDWRRKFAELNLKKMPREELANGLRVIARAVEAWDADQANTRIWMEQVRSAAQHAVARIDLELLEESPALSYAGREQLLATMPAVVPLRDAVKDFLALPRMRLMARAQDEAGKKDLLEATRATLDLVREIATPPDTKQTFESTVARLARYSTMLVKVLRGLEDVKVQGKLVADEKTTNELVEALSFLAVAMELASDRDWVGLALEVANGVDQHVAKRQKKQVARPLAFARVLLSMYQAESVEGAKALFEATLQDVASREERWTDWSVDVGALMAARYGEQRTRYYDPTLAPSEKQRPEIYGLYAPFGVQVAWKGIGGLAYPVDLGSYITAGEQAEDEPSWENAVRLGGAVYGRPFKTIPAVAGVGGDYRPRIDGRTEARVFGFIALELPLFVLH